MGICWENRGMVYYLQRLQVKMYTCGQSAGNRNTMESLKPKQENSGESYQNEIEQIRTEIDQDKNLINQIYESSAIAKVYQKFISEPRETDDPRLDMFEEHPDMKVLKNLQKHLRKLLDEKRRLEKI